MAASSSMMRILPAARDSLPAGRCASTAASDIYSLPAFHHGKLEMEGGTFTRLALHAYLPGMLLNDAVGHGESQAGAAPLPLAGGSRLGGEEWIVNALDVLLRDANARVRNHYVHAVSVGGLDFQGAALRHCIFRVQK